jgi:hypothetical protein
MKFEMWKESIPAFFRKLFIKKVKEIVKVPGETILQED